MKNKYGLPEDKLDQVAERDKDCVYCHKKMIFPWTNDNRRDSATIEHLNHLPPWDNVKSVTMCCGSCNSSRGALPLRKWFERKYCTDRDINEKTVAKVVKSYIRKFEK